jgi:dihydrofolate reductase
MGRLIYLLNVSLDGYVETPDRSLAWTSVDVELHQWFNDQMRSVEALLYGRRIYELMADHWPTAPADPAVTGVEREFAEIWLATPKVVFSSTLDHVDWNSRLVRGDIGTELAKLREEFDGDLAVAGATLAASFIGRGLVDEYRLVVHPVVIGSGTPFFPPFETPTTLRLLDSHVFSSGVTYLAYAPLDVTTTI